MAALSKRDIEMIFRAETQGATRNINDLAKAATGLKTSLQDQIKSAEKGEASLEKLAKTTADLKKIQDELATARSLVTALNSQNAALDKATERVDAANKKYADLKARVEGAEKPTKALVTSMEAAGRAASVAAERQAEANTRFTETKARIEAIVGPVDSVQGAFKQIATTSKEVTQGLATASAAADDFKVKLAGAADAEKALAQTQGFHKVAADAKLAAADVGRFDVATESSAASAARLSDAIFKIVAPAQAAANDLNQVASAIDAAENALNTKGKLRISQYQEQANGVSQAIAGLNRQAGQIDGFKQQQQAVDAATSRFQAAQGKVNALADAMLAADAPVEGLARDLNNARTALDAAGAAMGRERARALELGEGLRRVGIDVNNLEAAERRLIATAERAAVAQGKLAAKTGQSGAGGFLGLRPHELQNLNFQINDVFTSLASGIPIQQVIFQQGGQIAQLFPGLFSKLYASLGLVLPLVVAIGGAWAVFAREVRNTADLREANALLLGLGENVGYTAQQIVAAEKAMRDFGVSADDAQKAVAIAVRNGINPEAFDDFNRAAVNGAVLMGTTVPEAADKMATAFTRGAAEVLALDDQVHFLTDAQRDHLQVVKDTPAEVDAVSDAYDTFYNKAAAVASAQETEWSRATRTISTAWNDMLDTLAKTGVIDAVSNTISNAIKGLAVLINLAGEVTKKFKANAASLPSARDFAANPTVAIGQFIGGNLTGKDRRGFGQLLDDSIKKTQQQYNRSSATGPRSAPGAAPGTGSAGAQREKEQRDEKARKKAASDAKKAASDAETLRKQFENESDSLSNALSSMTATALKNQNASIDAEISNAEQAVVEQYKGLYDKLADFRKKFGANAKINGVTQSEYSEQLAANEKILIQTAKLKVYEDNVNDALSERKRRLDEITAQVKAGELTPQDGLARTLEVTSELDPKLGAIVAKAKEFIATLGDVDSPAIRELLSKLDGATPGTARGDSAGKEANRAILAEGQSQIDNLVQRRDALIAANKTLVELGVRTEVDGQRVAADAYKNSQVEIQKLVAEQTKLIDSMVQLGQIAPDVGATMKAELEAVNNEAIYVNENVRAMNNAIQDSFVDGFTMMFDTLAQGLAGLVTGTKNVGDVLADLGNAALSFAASFLKAMADVLVQMLAIQAVKALFGAGPGGGLGALFFHSGTESVGGGAGARRRSGLNISPAVVDMIPRYHSGTAGVGLKPREQLAVVEKGEKILTEEQQRRENKQMAALKTRGQGTAIRNVLAIGDSEVAAAMNGAAGEQTVLTHLRRNAAAVKQMVNG